MWDTRAAAPPLTCGAPDRGSATGTAGSSRQAALFLLGEGYHGAMHVTVSGMTRPAHLVRNWSTAWLEALGGANRRTMRRGYEEAYDNGDKTAPHAGPSDPE